MVEKPPPPPPPHIVDVIEQNRTTKTQTQQPNNHDAPNTLPESSLAPHRTACISNIRDEQQTIGKQKRTFPFDIISVFSCEITNTEMKQNNGLARG
jgi:hypothetical protein